MKLVTMFLAPIVAMGMASSASARDYHDLVAEGFRHSIEAPETSGLILLTHPMNLESLKARVRQHGLHGRLREKALKIQNSSGNNPPPWGWLLPGIRLALVIAGLVRILLGLP